jgi:hypothetical protein
VSGLLVSLGHESQESDRNLCIDFGSIGALGEERCAPGFTFVASSAGTGGLCVGGCRRGDTPAIRKITGLKYHDGTEHDIDLPVCVPALERRKSPEASRNDALNATYGLILALCIALVWIMIQHRKS